MRNAFLATYEEELTCPCPVFPADREIDKREAELGDSQLPCLQLN